MQSENACGFLIKQIHDALGKQANKTLRQQNLTMVQIHTLRTLYEQAGQSLSLKELERLLHVAQSTTAGIVARLEQKGFVETYGDAADRRIKLVHLTPRGEQCCQAARQNMEGAEEQLLSSLTATEQETFYALLQKVSRSLE